MKIVEILERADQIKRYIRVKEFNTAKALEYNLWKEVLETIAHHKTNSPEACALAALTTLKKRKRLWPNRK